MPSWRSQGQITVTCRVSFPASMVSQKLEALKHSDKLPDGTRDRDAAYANAAVRKVQYGRRSINTPRQCKRTDKTQSRTRKDKISQKLRRKYVIRISNAKAIIKLVKSSLLRPRRQYSCSPNLETACTWVVNLTLQPLHLRCN